MISGNNFYTLWSLINASFSVNDGGRRKKNCEKAKKQSRSFEMSSKKEKPRQNASESKISKYFFSPYGMVYSERLI